MTILKIYYLEDNKETNPVSTLEDGEHIIGRGETLRCNDKRVSRKHALINIQKDRVSIKSVHINPCFFKAGNGKSIEILQKDESLPLNDGDNFALLADNYWFRVKILNLSNLDAQVNDVQDPINNTERLNIAIPLSNSCKRCHTHDDDSCESCSKRTKLSQDELVDINSSVSSPKEILHQSSPREASVDLDGLLSSSSNVNVPHTETKVLLDNLENIINEDKTAAVIEEISDSEDSVDFLEIVKLKDNVKPDDEVAITIRTDVNDPVEVKTADVDVKVKDEMNNTNPGSSGINIQQQSTRRDFLEIANLKGNVKPDDEVATTIKTDVNDPVEVTADVDVKVKDEMDNTNPGSSGINIQQQSTRRDRCWYGSTCYRKNVTHRADFSHPGDPDYDDPADTRPDCPFGNECYRRNLDHRKQYKHSSKPAPNPRPVTPDGNTNSIADSPESGSDNNDDTERNRKVTKEKKNYSDDYDYNDPFIDNYNDPFIDNASSDDFQISTDDGSSSDWEDSEKVVEKPQETKRLLKEAKRFTKKHK